MKEKIKAFFSTDWSMSEKILLVADVLLFGILLGWITSPLRDGFSFFSNNSWDISGTGCDDEEEEEEE